MPSARRPARARFWSRPWASSSSSPGCTGHEPGTNLSAGGTSEGPRLHLVGDDEALDLLSELCRHLPLFQLARVDELPERLGPDDVVVIGAVHPRTRDVLLQRAMSRGTARHVALVSRAQDGSDAGARAILAAAELVGLLMPQLTLAGRG